MSMFRWNSFGIRRRRPGQSSVPEVLESRTLLSTFYVNGDNSQGTQDGTEQAPFGSIRQGIEAALQNPGDDEVIIQPRANSPYTTPIAITPGFSDVGIRGFDVFNGNLTIRGGGLSPSDVVIDTSDGDGIYVEAPISVTIANLTVTDSGRHGILYRSPKPMVIDNVHVTNQPNWTGIIVQGADLTIRNSLLENNLQGIWGGIGIIASTGVITGAPGKLTVQNTISRGNIYNGAYLRDLTGVAQFSSFTGEDNGFAGITISNSNSLNVNGGVYADNFYNGIVSTCVESVTIDGALIEDNGTADTFYNPGGGGIHIQPGSANLITIANSTIRGNANWGNGGGVEIWAPQTNFMANTTIVNTTIEDNATRLDGSEDRGHGGGVAVNGNSNLTISHSTIQGNAAYRGGGIDFDIYNEWNGEYALLTVNDTSILNNSSITFGGGINQQHGKVQASGTTIANNTAHSGGGIRSSSSATATITNSTISGNIASNGGGGFTNAGTASIINSTISSNATQHDGGGILNSGMVTLTNSIVANSTNLAKTAGKPDVANVSDGHFATSGSNLVESPNGIASLTGGSVINADPDLGPLRDNGGPTFTQALLPGSVAINAGNNSVALGLNGNLLTTDQRGNDFARILGGHVDLGAAETYAVLANSGSIIFRENDAAKPINPELSVAPNASVTKATVTITNFVTGEDGLSFENDGSTMGNITVDSNMNGVLILTSSGGTATTSAWQAALRAATYSNTSDSPNTTTRSVEFIVHASEFERDSITSTIHIVSIADTPTVTNSTTYEDVQSTIGLVISRNVADRTEVTHFRITNIVNGTLFHHDGTTRISSDDFITLAQGSTGLKFTPTADVFGVGRFDVHASIGNADAGIGGNIATATIIINAVADTPSVTSATTQINEQTTSGLVISRNAADGIEVTHFKIAQIVNGTLFQHDGTTLIGDGEFITFSQANAGLKFTPDLNSAATGHFTAQASVNNLDSGLGGWTVTADITVLLDKPLITESTATITEQRPTFTWSPTVGAANYQVWIASLSTRISAIVHGTPETSSYRPPIELGIGKFRIWVRAKASDGRYSEWSNGSYFQITTAPILNTVAAQQTTLRPSLTWTSLTGADRYEIYVSNLTTGTNQVVRDNQLTSPTFTDSNAWAIGNYRAWVRGIAADGFAGAWAPRMDFSVNAAPAVTQAGNSTIDRTPTFAWNALTGAASYEVFLRNQSTGITTLNQKNITATDFTPSSDLAEGQYRWWVRAKSAEGFYSLWTAPLDINIGGRTSLLPPTGSRSNATPTFTWNPVDGADHYDLWVNQVGGQYQIIRQQSLTSTTFTPTTALAAGTYRAWIRAISIAGKPSVWSNYVEFTVADDNSSLNSQQGIPDVLTDAAVATSDSVSNRHPQFVKESPDFRAAPSSYWIPSNGEADAIDRAIVFLMQHPTATI